MVSVTAAKDFYQAHFSQIEKDCVQNGQSWTRSIRAAAISRFSELGFPTVRDEEWKYTNVAPLAEISFRPASYKVNRATSDLVARARAGLVEAIQAV
ncbi:MAG: hypothetical protein AABZ69_01850, partial [Candidatus Binatota bacterium]